MGFAVFHMEKVSSGGKSLGAHIDREKGKEHTYKNADPSLKGENMHFNTEFSKMDLGEGINQRIKEGYSGKKAIRKDAVKAISMVFTGSHPDMKSIFDNKTKKDQWLEANIDFVKKEFGNDNIIRFTVHLDEKTPHIHAVVVPLTEDGRLSAKEIMGNREEMSARQTRYAQQMQPFGLERGVIGSKAVHNSEGWYLGQQKKEQEAILSKMPEFTVMDRINPSRYIENVLNGFKTIGKSKRDTELELSRRNQQLKTVTGELTNRVGQIKDLKLHLNIVNHKLNGYTLKPEFEKKFSDLQKTFQMGKNREVKIDFNKDLGDKKNRGLSR